VHRYGRARIVIATVVRGRRSIGTDRRRLGSKPGKLTRTISHFPVENSQHTFDAADFVRLEIESVIGRHRDIGKLNDVQSIIGNVFATEPGTACSVQTKRFLVIQAILIAMQLCAADGWASSKPLMARARMVRLRSFGTAVQPKTLLPRLE
jgi:hypothetical protein